MEADIRTTTEVLASTTAPTENVAATRNEEGPRMILCLAWPAPLPFNKDGNDNFKTIPTMPWFSRCAIMSTTYEQLEAYASDGQFFRGEDAAYIRRDVIATDPGDLTD